jgi:hypothetical protein
MEELEEQEPEHMEEDSDSAPPIAYNPDPSLWEELKTELRSFAGVKVRGIGGEVGTQSASLHSYATMPAKLQTRYHWSQARACLAGILAAVNKKMKDYPPNKEHREIYAECEAILQDKLEAWKFCVCSTLGVPTGPLSFRKSEFGTALFPKLLKKPVVTKERPLPGGKLLLPDMEYPVHARVIEWCGIWLCGDHQHWMNYHNRIGEKE